MTSVEKTRDNLTKAIQNLQRVRYYATKGDYWLGDTWIKSCIDVFKVYGHLWCHSDTLDFDSWELLQQWVSDHAITLEGGE